MDKGGFLNRRIAKQAVDTYLQAFLAFIKQHGKQGLHIVILKPWAKYIPGQTELKQSQILYEFSINQADWKPGSDYKKFARAKALLSLRTGMNSGAVPKHLYITGDIKFRGSIYHNGIIVGTSGVKSVQDESCSFAVANECEALVVAGFKHWDDKDEIFVP